MKGVVPVRRRPVCLHQPSAVEPGTPRRRRDEGGFAMIWTAMILVVMMGFCGFAIDVAHWYLWANREQHAADAGALAGVIFMPQDFTTASSVAKTTAQRNGFPAGSIQVQSTSKPSQLMVTVTYSVDNFFGKILGKDTTTLKRSAIAEYQGPVPMGSPVNGMGNEPVVECDPDDFAGGSGDPAYQACLTREESKWVTDSNQGMFWVSISGARRDKGTGDAYQSMVCSTSSDGCPVANQNADYSSEGYIYAVKVPSGAAGQSVTIQAFDPAWIEVADRCNHSNISTSPRPEDISTGLVPDARYRYADGAASPFCSGDNRAGGETANGHVTTFILREPDGTPWSNADNPVITSCTKQFVGFTGALEPRLNPSKPEYELTLADGRTVADTFRQWVTLCTITGAQAGEYLLQIKTNAPYGNPEAVDTSQGCCANRFALRAGVASGSMPGMTAVANGIVIQAVGKLGIYANADGADTKFYLTRILPDTAGRWLSLRFYDTGDASTAGELRILPPPEFAAGFTGCTYSGPYSGGQSQLNQCKVVGLHSSNGFNGKWMQVNVPIPTNYTCNAGSDTGCWVLVQFIYPAGQSVTDTTTWTASILGDPVRLVG